MSTYLPCEELESRIKILENEAKQSRHKIETLQKSEAYLQAILNNTNLPIYLKDHDYRYIFVNRQYEKLAHVTLDEIRGKEDYDIFPAPVAKLFRSQDKDVRECKALVEFTETVPLPDGELTFITAKFPLYDAAGNLYALGGVCTDITERKRAEEELLKSEERYRLVMGNINDAVFICKLDGHLKYMSPSIVRLTGYSSNEMLNVHYLHFIHPDFRKRELELYIKQVQENIEVVGHEYPFLAKGGGIIWVGQTARMAMNNKGEMEFFGVIRDITERRQAEAALKESEERYRKLSIIDGLTQLYNSRHLYNQLKIEIDRVNRYNEPMSIILFDLDNFKAFNDAYGHIEGDQVLMRLGQVIKKCLRKTDSAYRYGGEEFIILLPMTICEDALITAERVKTEFKKENFSPVSDKTIHMTLSFGVGQYKPQEEMKVFVHRVDQLMYQAKKNGKDRVCYELND